MCRTHAQCVAVSGYIADSAFHIGNSRGKLDLGRGARRRCHAVGRTRMSSIAAFCGRFALHGRFHFLEGFFIGTHLAGHLKSLLGRHAGYHATVLPYSRTVCNA